MSQIEQNFKDFLLKHPEIEACFASGLLNRRSLARHLIRKGVAKEGQLEATVAMLRRFPFVGKDEKKPLVPKRSQVKDNIAVLTLAKSKKVFDALSHISSSMNYDQGDTFKVITGTEAVTLFLDEERVKSLEKELKSHTTISQEKNVCQISLLFDKSARSGKGVLALITRALVLHDIPVIEMITSHTELLLYVHQDQLLKTLQVLQDLR